MDEKYHVSGKGILVREGKILLIKYFEEGIGIHYNIPGGRQIPNERITETVRRKMVEEAGASVRVGRFLYMYEYIGANHENSMGNKHSVSLIFECALEKGSEPGMDKCTKPDEKRQIDVSWVDLKDLNSILLFPHMAERIQEFATASWAGVPDPYVGDID